MYAPRRAAGARKYRSRPTLKKSGKKLAPSTRKAVAQIARSAVKRIAETKYVQNSPLNYSVLYGSTLPQANSAGLTSPPQLYSCCPDILQGDFGHDREGNTIQPIKHTTDVRVTFSTTPADISSGVTTTADTCAWDVTLHCWYGFVRRYKSATDVIANASSIVTVMFETGQGGTTPFTGNSMDEYLQLNKDFVSFKHKKVRMRKDAGRTNALEFDVPSQPQPANEVGRLHLNWKVPKTLRYSLDASPLPEEYAPVIIMGYTHNDYSQSANTTYTTGTPTLLNTPALMFQKVDKLWFKDF